MSYNMSLIGCDVVVVPTQGTQMIYCTTSGTILGAILL